MGKIEKIEKKIKHYFTLDENINSIFIKYIEDNLINKQKLLEKITIQYLKDKKIIKEND